MHHHAFLMVYVHGDGNKQIVLVVCLFGVGTSDDISPNEARHNKSVSCFFNIKGVLLEKLGSKPQDL